MRDPPEGKQTDSIALAGWTPRPGPESSVRPPHLEPRLAEGRLKEGTVRHKSRSVTGGGPHVRPADQETYRGDGDGLPARGRFLFGRLGRSTPASRIGRIR